nr:transient receptor potential channel pyrexia [Leptinotarsa decemlineata]
MEATTKLPLASGGDDMNMLRWSKDIEKQVGDFSSISSEDETGSEFDTERRVRENPSQEIWNPTSIWDSLMNLPDAEDINELFSKEDIQTAIRKNKDTTLLLATWLGKLNVLTACLRAEASLDTTDENGRSALHLAAYAGKSECLKVLLGHGANVNIWDNSQQITPLHCAAGGGNLDCLKLLIDSGADVNAGLNNPSNKSPLYFAVQSNAVDCVRELLQRNATPNTQQVFSETPLHVAASLGHSFTMKLLLEHGAAVDVQCGRERMTPLHLAAEDGDLECVKILINAGAVIGAKNYKKQTPLHLAALSQCTETIALLIRKGADVDAADSDGRTPLHCSIVKASRSCECVRVLLCAGPNVNKPDIFGYTPLHLAALNEYPHCVMLLINNGGDVTARTKGGVSVLTFIIRKTPDVITRYVMKFDNAIKLTDHELGDVDCELKLDFRVLVPTMGNKETELLLNFIEVGHKEVLNHPLCATFLFLKWRRIRKFFLFSLFYHSLFVCLFTIYVIGAFLNDCPYSKTGGKLCWVSHYTRNVGYVMILLNMMLLGKELFQIAHSWFIYMKQWENWLQWMIIISVFVCVRQDVYNWEHHVAAISIFLSWVELMMIVGRFPIFGLYIQMFTTVSVNFGKFMLAYFCLFIAFSLSFGVIFANHPVFSDLKWVLLKVIIMMSGELEYEDDFFPEDKNQGIKYPYTAQLMYLCFVLLVTVILTNLMVGLAVSDIQGLQQSAGLDRLVRQAELVAHLESMLFSRLLTWVPQKLMGWLHKTALLLKSQYDWALYIRPNDPREEKIPRPLIRAIYQLVVEKKDRPRNRKHGKFKSDYYYDTVSPSLSRLSSYNSYGLKKDLLGKTQVDLLKIQMDDISNEFKEYNKFFQQKIDKIYQVLNDRHGD